MKELTEPQFRATYDAPMRLLPDDDTSCAHLKLTGAVQECLDDLELEIDVDEVELHFGYQNDRQDYCHLGFNWGDPNLYLVLVVQPRAGCIYGYTVIDTTQLADSSRA